MTQKEQKTAVIVGASGQDGTLLKQSLLDQGYQVVGVSRSAVTISGESPESSIGKLDIADSTTVFKLVEDISPDEIYYLAAHHVSSETSHSNTDPDEYAQHTQVQVTGLLNFLSAIHNVHPECRLFYASTSLIFDGSTGPFQDENTPYSPVGFYGITKVQGMLLCREFRQKSVFASTGILYNHESALRRRSFLSKKLIVAAHRISLGLESELVLGSLDAQVDWGYAPDFIEAFQKILRSDQPDDFVVATGESHTVKEFAKLVFECFSLDAENFVRENSSILHRRQRPKIGSYAHLEQVTGWKPGFKFPEMVQRLVNDYLASPESKSQTLKED